VDPQVLFIGGTVVATAVAVLFATLGDGVSASDATGLRALVIDHAHTAVWVLLATALLVASVQGRWQGLSGAIASVAGVLYLVFLAAVRLNR
jgi:hypothetical protein